jgi:hypothetical protein
MIAGRAVRGSAHRRKRLLRRSIRG